MEFNDTTNKNGMIQRFEYWTRMSDGEVTGTLLKQITASINDGFDSIIPLLTSYSDFIRWDDSNHTDRPIGTVQINDGQNDYTIAQDDNSLDILNLTRVMVLKGASQTEYENLIRMTIDDRRAPEMMSPNPSSSGIPTHFLEVGNTIFLGPNNPNYTVAAGLKLFFERQQSYFVFGDTTKEPGFVRTFHILPVLYAARDWMAINRADEVKTINNINIEIVRKEKQLSNMISMRNRTRGRMTPGNTHSGESLGNESGRIHGRFSSGNQ